MVDHQLSRTDAPSRPLLVWLNQRAGASVVNWSAVGAILFCLAAWALIARVLAGVF